MSVETKPENPPAFPVMKEFEQWDADAGRYRSHILPEGGMLLRDWFAGQAMQGLIATGHFDAELIASNAYQKADALLKERSKP